MFVAAETNHHAGLVEQAAETGKTIICYKPMALTMADRIVVAVKKHSVSFTMGWEMRCDPQNLRIEFLNRWRNEHKYGTAQRGVRARLRAGGALRGRN